MNKHHVGILVNSSLYKGIPLGKTLHECLPFYEDAGKTFDLTPCYFRLEDIRPGQQMVAAFVKSRAGYIRKEIPVPSVIHNRALYFTSSAKKKIERLVKDGKTIFNQWNRYGKLTIHELLMLDLSLRTHLPASMSANLDNLQQMMQRYDSLIIKPNSGSIGQGIMKVERTESGWNLLYPYGGVRKLWRSIVFTHVIPRVIKHRLLAKPYVIQQRLPLATYMGRPFDLRVSVQRDISGEWQVTGIAGKVAKKEAFITNVAQGGTVYPLEALVKLYPDMEYNQVYSDIVGFSLRAAHHLGMHLPLLADIGLDIGITEHGFPMFIECNGRDLRYSFQKGHMPEQWKATYSNPMGYARYLIDH